VLAARAIPGEAPHSIDLGGFAKCAIVSARGEHIRIDANGRLVRLDVAEGTLLAGPASVTVELPIGTCLPEQLAALSELRHLLAGRSARTRKSKALHSQLFALAAYDARADGASLRAIADTFLGHGDWPGDGEHRKSRARRLIAKGAAMIRAGPRAILR